MSKRASYLSVIIFLLWSVSAYYTYTRMEPPSEATPFICLVFLSYLVPLIIVAVVATFGIVVVALASIIDESILK